MLCSAFVHEILERATRANGSKHDTECNRYLLGIALDHYELPPEIRATLDNVYKPSLNPPSTYSELVDQEFDGLASCRELRTFVEAKVACGLLPKDKRRFVSLLKRATNELCTCAVLAKGQDLELQEAILWILRNAMLFADLTNGLKWTCLQLEQIVYFCTHCVLAWTCYGKHGWGELKAKDLYPLACLLSKFVPSLLLRGMLEPLLEALTVIRMCGTSVDQAAVYACMLMLEKGPTWRTNAGLLMSTWHVVAILVQFVWMPAPPE